MQFTYRAKQGKQSEAAGVIEAVDLSAAVAHLKGMGLYPTEVVPLEKETSRPASAIPSAPLSRMGLSLWARTVGQGLRAGLSLTQSLHLLAQQEEGRVLGQVAKFLEEKVTAGMNLADAMNQMGKLFSPVAISLVKAGEASGALEQVLQGLAEQTESEAELVAKVRGALVYPLFVLTIGAGTVAILLWFVVPKLGSLFTETGQKLPALTQFLMRSGRAMVLGLAAAILAVGGTSLFLRLRGRHLPFFQWGAQAMSRLPLFGRLILQGEIARLCSVLGLLLGNGLPLPESLRLVSGTLTQSSLQSKIKKTEQDVVEGLNLSASLRQADLREPFLLTMVAVGEAQGDLAAAFRQAGERYRQEVDRTVRVLSTLIEPVMILLVGLVVGGIVFSMLLPIFQMNFSVSG